MFYMHTPLNSYNNPARQVLLLIPILKMRLLNLTQIKKLAQGHTVTE